VFALLLGWAVLREQPLGWTRLAARGGVIAGGLALVVSVLWIVLAVFGV
jgi:hypothetical protein